MDLQLILINYKIKKKYIKKDERNKGHGKKLLNLLSGTIYLDIYDKNTS